MLCILHDTVPRPCGKPEMTSLCSACNATQWRFMCSHVSTCIHIIVYFRLLNSHVSIRYVHMYINYTYDLIAR